MCKEGNRPTREQTPLKLLGFMGAIWSLLFAFAIVIIGPQLTSAQWQYLLSFPGGEWSWGAAFLVGGALTLWGLIKTDWKLAATGCGFWGAACSLITIFYFLSPWVGPGGIVTLGWIPWMFPALCGFGCVAVYSSDKSW